MAIISPLSTTNTEIDILSGTGAINIGTGSFAKSITIGTLTGASSLTLNVGSGGLNVPSFSANGVLISNASGLVSNLAAGTSGYVLTSNGSGSAPSFQAISSGGTVWNTVTAGQAMVAGNGYIANSSTRVSLSLPATSVVGATVSIMGLGSGGWSVTQVSSSQQIMIGNASTTLGTSGYLSSDNQYDSVVLVCIVADSVWACLGGPQSAGLLLT